MVGKVMLPNFIVVGGAKCGTSSLCDSLGRHPDIFMSTPKEPHFFSALKTPDDVVEYEKLFADAGGCTAIGEGSTSYTAPNRVRRASRKIAKLIPHCKLIYIARHPIRRIESDWRMRLHEGWAPESINEAVKARPDLISAGLYWDNISHYRNLFSDDQIKVVFMEDLSSDPVAVLNECYSFLDVDILNDDFKKEGVIRNDSAGFRSMNRSVSRLTEAKLAQSVKNYLPAYLRGRAKSLFSKEYDFTISWDRSLLEVVIEELRDDAECFLEFYGKPKDFWLLDSDQFLVSKSKVKKLVLDN
jgi:hypothetical protein